VKRGRLRGNCENLEGDRGMVEDHGTSVENAAKERAASFRNGRRNGHYKPNEEACQPVSLRQKAHRAKKKS